MTVMEEEMVGSTGAAAIESASAESASANREPTLAGSEMNDTRVEFPSCACLHDLIEKQAQRTPGATAVKFDDTQLTYRELNDRADDLATQLQDFGVGPDVPVGLCVERSVEMVVALLGILKAGGCYIPLDPAYPRERLTLMLEDARPAVLLTQRRLRDRLELKNPNIQILCVDENDVALQLPHSVSRLPHPASSNLAYVIYTSGSTGKPKGVMITHRNVVNFFTGMDRVLGTERGVWLAVTSISFDISVLEIFWTLTRGFTVVIRAEESRAGNATIPEQIIRYGVTHLQCTPSLAGSLVRTAGAREALRRLSKFLVGGEALPAALAAQLRQSLRGELLNMYGPTETTVWSATHPVVDATNLVAIGRPIANTQIHILDEDFRPVVNGAAGEIFIGGEGVARGYFNRPELTAERFIPDPFHPHSGARLYRTGDVGRCRADGAIEFLGRVDNQVKLDGHRIELGEIESILHQHPAVRECVVHAWEPEPGDKRLAAYMVPATASTASVVELRRFLEPKLPHYMIPAAFVWLERMPLTPNGKINRKALPKPEPSRPRLDTAYAPPQNQIEQTLANIWREVLRVERVGTQDNFFDLGGSSLLLMETHRRLRAALNIDLPIVRLFEHPTIAALAKLLAGHEKSPPNDVRERALRQRGAFWRRQPRAVSV